MAEIVISGVRLNHAKLWKPDHYNNDPSTKKRYDANFMVEHDSATHTQILGAIDAAAVAVWGAKAQTILDMCRADKMKYCYQDGDKKLTKDGDSIDSLAGYFILGAHRAEKLGPPRLLSDRLVALSEADGVLYDGCYVNAKIEIWGQPKGTGAPGIRCSFSKIQFAKDGDRLSGGGVNTPDDEDFDVIETGENSAYGLV